VAELRRYLHVDESFAHIKGCPIMRDLVQEVAEPVVESLSDSSDHDGGLAGNRGVDDTNVPG